MKLKALKPSMREKKRYLLIRDSSKKQIETAIMDGIGVIGYSETGLAFVKESKKKRIISINREALNKVRACLSIFPKKIIVERVSGTIKGLRTQKL